MEEDPNSSHNSNLLPFSPQKVIEHILLFGPINHLFIQKYEDGPLAAVQFCRWCRGATEGVYPALDDYLEKVACNIKGDPVEFDNTYKKMLGGMIVKYARYVTRFFDIMCTIDKYKNRGEQPDISDVNVPASTTSDKINNKDLINLVFRNGIKRHETVHRQLEARLINIVFHLEEIYYPGFKPPFIFADFENKQEADLLKMILKGKVDEAIRLGPKQEFIVSLLVLQALQKHDQEFLNSLDNKKEDIHSNSYTASNEKVHRPKRNPKEPEQIRTRNKPKKGPKPIEELADDNPDRFLTAEEVEEYMPLCCASSLTIISMGRICKKSGYSNGKYLYNPGFRSERLYFDLDDPEDRCIYISSIHEGPDGPVFHVQKKGSKHIYKAAAPSAAWLDVIKDIEEVKKANNMALRGSLTVSGPEFFGLSHHHVMKLMRRMAHLEDVVSRPPQPRRVRKVRSLRERQTDVRSTQKNVELPLDEESESTDPEPQIDRQMITIMRNPMPARGQAPILSIRFPQEAFICTDEIESTYEIKGDPLEFKRIIEEQSNEIKKSRMTE